MRPFVAILFALALAGCTEAPHESLADGPGFGAPSTMTLTSSAFVTGETIPAEFTCDGANASPPLAIGGVPDDAVAFAFIMHDPDAPRQGGFLHWTWWDVPANTTTFAANASITDLGGREGNTDTGRPGYVGPCPPSGTHRYFLRAYALSEPLGLETGASFAAFERALAGRVVAYGELMGTYR